MATKLVRTVTSGSAFPGGAARVAVPDADKASAVELFVRVTFDADALAANGGFNLGVGGGVPENAAGWAVRSLVEAEDVAAAARSAGTTTVERRFAFPHFLGAAMEVRFPNGYAPGEVQLEITAVLTV